MIRTAVTEVSSHVPTHNGFSRSGKRTWIRRGAIVLGIVLVLWLTVSSVVAYRLTHRPRPRFEERAPRVAWGQLEDHHIKTSDGEPLKAIGGIPNDVPVLILAGDADRLARPEEARALFSQVATHGKLVFFPGAEHHNLSESAPELFQELGDRRDACPGGGAGLPGYREHNFPGRVPGHV
jgi:pimeloyl-ACP methyl ester carboxylesterase